MKLKPTPTLSRIFHAGEFVVAWGKPSDRVCMVTRSKQRAVAIHAQVKVNFPTASLQYVEDRTRGVTTWRSVA